MIHPADTASRLRAALRDVPDFPKPGILFKDITPVLQDAELLSLAVRAMTWPFRDAGVTHVAAPESRGFIFGVPIALALGAGFVPVRKRGKLPWRTQRVEYALEYGTDVVEVHVDAVPAGGRVLLVDDVLATGGTAAAAVELLGALGASVVGCSFLLELPALAGRTRLVGTPVSAVVEC